MFLLEATEPTSLLEWLGIGGGSIGGGAFLYWILRRLLNRLLTSIDDLSGSVKEAHDGVGGLTHALEMQATITGKEITAMKDEATATRQDMRAGFDKIEQKLEEGQQKFSKVGEELVACRSDIEHNKDSIKRISDKIEKHKRDHS